MPFASFPRRPGDMFVAICTTPKASPAPTRPHKTWSFLVSPDCNTPPPEELLEDFLSESPIRDPFSDQFYLEELSHTTPPFENPPAEDPYLPEPPSKAPSSRPICPYPEEPIPLASSLQYLRRTSIITNPPFSPFNDTPGPPSPFPTTYPERIAIINLTPHALHLAAVFSRHFPTTTLVYDRSPALTAQAARAYPALTFTSSARALAAADYFLVCLPNNDGDDDDEEERGRVDDTAATIRQIATHARPGATVVIETATAATTKPVPVGTTRALLAHLHRYRGMLGGVASASSASASSFKTEEEEEPKLVSGLCHRSLASIVSLYSRVYSTLLTMSAPEVVEGAGLRGRFGW